MGAVTEECGLFCFLAGGRPAWRTHNESVIKIVDDEKCCVHSWCRHSTAALFEAARMVGPLSRVSRRVVPPRCWLVRLVRPHTTVVGSAAWDCCRCAASLAYSRHKQLQTLLLTGCWCHFGANPHVVGAVLKAPYLWVPTPVPSHFAEWSIKPHWNSTAVCGARNNNPDHSHSLAIFTLFFNQNHHQPADRRNCYSDCHSQYCKKHGSCSAYSQAKLCCALKHCCPQSGGIKNGKWRNALVAVMSEHLSRV